MTDDQIQKLAMLGRAFNPTSAVNERSLFRGRISQLAKTASAISARGAHIVLFGDRGVGKTSLTLILKSVLGSRESLELHRVNCNESDTFLSVWRNALNEIAVISELPPDGDGNPSPVTYQLSEWLNGVDQVNSYTLRKILELKCGDGHHLVIVFDEFDRLSAAQRKPFADTIKDFSDNSTSVTIMLVGVAQDISALIQEHKSVERNLVQIYMPPMADHELKEIIDTGLKMLRMTIAPAAKEAVVSLSKGYPYYTHLLCLGAAHQAIMHSSDEVAKADVSHAVREAVSTAHVSVREAYSQAADGQRKGTTYPRVLLASALVETDDMGYFRPSDLREPITNAKCDYTEQLNMLATDPNRGEVFERTGKPRRYKYRFRNPLLRPYIIMKGIADGQVAGTFFQLFIEEEPAERAGPNLFKEFE